MHTYILPSWTNVSMKLRLYLKFNFKPNLQQKKMKNLVKGDRMISGCPTACASDLRSLQKLFQVQESLASNTLWVWQVPGPPAVYYITKVVVYSILFFYFCIRVFFKKRTALIFLVRWWNRCPFASCHFHSSLHTAAMYSGCVTH